MNAQVRTEGGLRAAFIPFLILSLPILLLTSCATIMHGSTQSVSISSTPSGAQVTVNGAQFGTTPVVADLKRKDQHLVRVELDGFQPYEVALSRSVSGWVVGNLVFGGLVGLAVDAITGGMYKLNPEQVVAALNEAQSPGAQILGSDNLVVLVVLSPDDGWERIGTMQEE